MLPNENNRGTEPCRLEWRLYLLGFRDCSMQRLKGRCVMRVVGAMSQMQVRSVNQSSPGIASAPAVIPPPCMTLVNCTGQLASGCGFRYKSIRANEARCRRGFMDAEKYNFRRWRDYVGSVELYRSHLKWALTDRE